MNGKYIITIRFSVVEGGFFLLQNTDFSPTLLEIRQKMHIQICKFIVLQTA